MKYEEFVKYLKNETIDKNVLLLFGEETFLKQHCKTELLKKVTPEQMPEFNIFSFDGRKYDLVAVDEAIEALPVMSDKKLLLFRNSMLFTITGKDTATKDYKEYWEKRLKNIPEDVYIIFDEDKIDKRSGLYKTLLKKDAIAEFSYWSKNELVNWLMKLFQRMGRKISPFDAEYLVAITADGMLNLKRNAEKICAYTEGKSDIVRTDIDAVVIPTLEDKVFDMVNAILDKNTQLALDMLQDICATKDGERTVLAAISSNVFKLLNVKLMLECNVDKSVIASKNKIPPFFINNHIKLSQKHTKKELESLLEACVKTDRLIKTSPVDILLLLQCLIADFAEEK